MVSGPMDLIQHAPLQHLLGDELRDADADVHDLPLPQFLHGPLGDGVMQGGTVAGLPDAGADLVPAGLEDVPRGHILAADILIETADVGELLLVRHHHHRVHQGGRNVHGAGQHMVVHDAAHLQRQRLTMVRPS